MNGRRAACAVVVAVLFLGTGVEACGPDFEPDVFIRMSAPDDVATFAQGKLGLLGSGYDSNAYAVAYRYLNGGTLSAAEQRAFVGTAAQSEDWTTMTPQEIGQARAAQQAAAVAASAPGQWLAARGQYVPALATKEQATEFPKSWEGTIEFDPSYPNCPDGAFRTATLTLARRAKAWGGGSAWLKDWIAGQDAVFANCARNATSLPWLPPGQKAAAPMGPSVPEAAPADGPLLFKEDRAYQIAAAAFYAKDFDQAARDFEAIAKDTGSPWSRWGTYLAARATVRKAFATGKVTNPYDPALANFDVATMQQAQAMLEGLLAEAHPGPSREAVTAELNFVRLRTEPGKRVNEIATALAGPGPDAHFGQDLDDLSFALEKQLPVKSPAPLYAWIEAWRRAPAGSSPVATWQQTHALPWLALAMTQAQASDASAGDLLAAAANVGPGTGTDRAAWETVFYHRVRLLIGMGKKDEARALLEAVLPGQIAGKPDSFLNGLLAERMAVARNFDEFLRYAPRTILQGDTLTAGSGAPLWPCSGHPAWLKEMGHCPVKGQPPGFDVDAVTVLNEETPMALWVKAAESPLLPPNLHEDVVLAGWTRAVVLEDAASAAQLARLLPATIRKTAGTGVEYAADLAILENPGLRPYVETGTSRLENYTELDEFRDNWWSSDWRGRYQSASPLGKVDGAGFLTAAELAEGAAEYQKLDQPASGAVVIGQRVVDYAKTHANDATVPEALALTVRATHYGALSWTGGEDQMQANQARVTAVGKAAFTLLHARYPESEWTKKTPFYY